MYKAGREPDETMQLKVPASMNADETVLLRTVDVAATDNANPSSATAPDGSAPGRSRHRRRVPRTARLSRIPVAGPRLNRLVTRVGSHAHRLRPRYRTPTAPAGAAGCLPGGSGSVPR